MYIDCRPARTDIQQYVYQTDMTTDSHTHSLDISGAPAADEQ